MQAVGQRTGAREGDSRNSANLRPRRLAMNKSLVTRSQLRGELTNELVTRSAPGWREVRARHQSQPISGRSEFGAQGNKWLERRNGGLEMYMLTIRSPGDRLEPLDLWT